MSEAHGVILIQAPAPLLQLFDPDSEKVPRQLLLKIFEAAAVDEAVLAAVFKGRHQRRSYAHEGLERHADGVQIALSGDAWSQPLQALTRYGVGVALYGSLHHEDGLCEYFALDPQGRRFFKAGYLEAGPDTVRQIALAWQACLPPELLAQYPEVLAAGAWADDSATDAPPVYIWVPQQDADFVSQRDGVLRLNDELLIPKHYQREHLLRARDLGARLVGTADEGEVPRSDLHWLLSSLEHNMAQKTQMALDMLDLFEPDLAQVCRGYGENVGTALYLAAKTGLPEVVDRLLALGAPAALGQDGCPLNVARQQLAFEVMMKRKPKDIDMSTRTEGLRADYERIVTRLKALPRGG